MGQGCVKSSAERRAETVGPQPQSLGPTRPGLLSSWTPPGTRSSWAPGGAILSCGHHVTNLELAQRLSTGIRPHLCGACLRGQSVWSVRQAPVKSGAELSARTVSLPQRLTPKPPSQPPPPSLLPAARARAAVEVAVSVTKEFRRSAGGKTQRLMPEPPCQPPPRPLPAARARGEVEVGVSAKTEPELAELARPMRIRAASRACWSRVVGSVRSMLHKQYTDASANELATLLCCGVLQADGLPYRLIQLGPGNDIIRLIATFVLKRRPLVVGAEVLVTRAFLSDTADEVMLEKGYRGEVRRIDEEHDAYIFFRNGIGSEWVDAEKRHMLRIVSLPQCKTEQYCYGLCGAQRNGSSGYLYSNRWYCPQCYCRVVLHFCSGKCGASWNGVDAWNKRKKGWYCKACWSSFCSGPCGALWNGVDAWKKTKKSAWFCQVCWGSRQR